MPSWVFRSNVTGDSGRTWPAIPGTWPAIPVIVTGAAIYAGGMVLHMYFNW